MKAASAVEIYRSVGDGDPILVDLKVLIQAGEVSVIDTATAALRVKIADTVLIISGTALGSGTGIWAFSPVGLPAAPGRLQFSVAVTVDGYTYTHGRGLLDLADKV
ncbi:MAG: hypothetical protein JWS10_942 [Cypionkella sp.]|uniref:hypothetical protein n=1 Tax=Cypionkella sp. TaxID=2811411 RepID=UPI0026043B5D|nr:hypothetical protein [Cypionkella sp.]MDB5658327.1 hypothetical protein [Cypionkella sp.]